MSSAINIKMQRDDGKDKQNKVRLVMYQSLLFLTRYEKYTRLDTHILVYGFANKKQDKWQVSEKAYVYLTKQQLKPQRLICPNNKHYL